MLEVVTKETNDRWHFQVKGSITVREGQTSMVVPQKFTCDEIEACAGYASKEDAKQAGEAAKMQFEGIVQWIRDGNTAQKIYFIAQYLKKEFGGCEVSAGGLSGPLGGARLQIHAPERSHEVRMTRKFLDGQDIREIIRFFESRKVIDNIKAAAGAGPLYLVHRP